MDSEIENKENGYNIKPVATSLFNQSAWIIHAIIWFVLLAFPFLFFTRETNEVTFSDYLRYLTMIIGIFIVFYVNYLYFVKRFIFSRKLWQFIIANLMLFVVMIIVSHLVMEMLSSNEFHRRPPRERENMIIVFWLFDFIKYTFVAALSVAMKMTGNWYRVDAERKELEKMRSEAELQNLKSQLNPHFLFNTLNNIYSLIAISSERAQEAVHVLSGLLRYILYESSQPLVAIEKDIDFVRNYIELMRIRLPQHAELKTDIKTSSPGGLIAPLLFISLIENAFKHGVSNNKSCFIDININSDNEQVKCSIRNSYFPKDEQDRSGSGIGVTNLRKRLDLLYPDSHKFICERIGDDFISDLIITLPPQS